MKSEETTAAVPQVASDMGQADLEMSDAQWKELFEPNDFDFVGKDLKGGVVDYLIYNPPG